jgi:UDP-glucose 4-epimerase
MRALVTGGAGFIGSHLVDALLARGDSAVVLDNLATGRPENVRHHLLNRRFELVVGSVLDAGLVDDLMARCEVVFHLAATVGMRLILDRPLRSLMASIRGTETVLERACEHGRKVLITSSSEIYGKSPRRPLHERSDRLLGSPLVARWSYATAKSVDEALAHGYWRERQLPTVITRLFNTVGQRQTGRYGMVLPRFIGQALGGRDLTVYGDGSQTRCFSFVGDLVPALIALMECPEAEGQAVNLGSTEEISVLGLAELVLDRTGSSSRIRFVPFGEVYGDDFEEVQNRVPDTARARQYVGFQPRTSLAEILDLMIAEAAARR